MANNEDTIAKDWHALLFAVRRSVRYHDHRTRFFDRLHRSFSALMLFGGSGAAYGAITAINPHWLVAAASLTALLAALNLVLEPARFARLHSDLKRRFVALERQINSESTTPEVLVTLTDTRLTIEADEPPILRNLDTICHNELLLAMGYGSAEQKPLTPTQRRLAPLLDWRFNQQPATPQP